MITFNDCVFRQVEMVPPRWKEGLKDIPDGTVFENKHFIYENNEENAIWFDPWYYRKNKLQRIWKLIIEKFSSVIAIRWNIN